MWLPQTPLSEDCLFLNVWVPHPRPSSPAPILFWIHGGGGFLTGSASVGLYNGASLAASENVLVVSINYRLGVLGFLSLPPASPGNMGLWDQHLALSWIKENAAAFGGDPNRLTLFGHNSGAVSVGLHLLSPQSRPLFAQAVLQSGTANAFWAWMSPEKAKQKTLAFSQRLGCAEGEENAVVRCLQEKDAAKFTQHELSMVTESKFLLDLPFLPTTDGEFLTDDPKTLLGTGRIQVKPTLIGVTSDEASTFVPFLFPNTTDGLIARDQLLKAIKMTLRTVAEEDIEAVAQRYSEGDHSPAQYRSAMTQALTDYIFVCPASEFAAKSQEAGSRMYVYYFTHHTSGSVFPEWIGAPHGSEVPYVFGTLELAIVAANRTYTEPEAALSRRMMRYWAEFSRSGKPTGLGAKETEWPVYDAALQNFFHLSTESSQATQISPTQKCDFLKAHSLKPAAAMPVLLSSCLALFFLVSCLASSEEDIVVITSTGPIKGKQVPAGSGNATAYLGIPYAEPPVGKLRFQKPLPHQPWSHVLEATSYGSPCYQQNSLHDPYMKMWFPDTPPSEDCLFLNIWVPHPRPATPMPLLVWIHGGGFFAGASSMDLYNGALLAATENVIVASMNYRLGILGFLYSPPDAPGNMGLWDQHLALKWVKENAAAFGGDPARVTLVGHSAGAASVGFHLLSPASQPLFAQAVMQSGAPNSLWAWEPPKKAALSIKFLMKETDCGLKNHSVVVSCLQGLDAGDDVFYRMDALFKPTPDGDFLPDEPLKLLQTGQVQTKPLLFGVTSDDGSIFVFSPGRPNNDEILTWEELLEKTKVIMTQPLEDDVVKAVALKYSEDGHGPERYRGALAQFCKDHFFFCPLMEFAASMATSGNPIYGYSFNHYISGSIWSEWMGAVHGAEVPYLFGTLSALPGRNHTTTEADTALIQRMMRYWADFARTGNPTGSIPGKVQWPLYNATEQKFFHISTEAPQVMQLSPAHQCQFLKTHLFNTTQREREE
ncbi:hypothetical protein JRQ81_003407 [Phrynocephalus forsythii]|uniref:Carboxylesterase type B domain-containing protein n=1 Tax=Phrynocephalus forsythii TaxID=171643 RepID=A0A9Q0XLN3_9SAUR|nr:hypothetical protein JRQ81_003407 [Phrynocephalus forsythii]